MIAINFFLSLAVLEFILKKLPFEWYEVPTMLLEKVSRPRLERKFCLRVHLLFSYKNVASESFYKS